MSYCCKVIWSRDRLLLHLRIYHSKALYDLRCIGGLRQHGEDLESDSRSGADISFQFSTSLRIFYSIRYQGMFSIVLYAFSRTFSLATVCRAMEVDYFPKVRQTSSQEPQGTYLALWPSYSGTVFQFCDPSLSTIYCTFSIPASQVFGSRMSAAQFPHQ